MAVTEPVERGRRLVDERAGGALVGVALGYLCLDLLLKLAGTSVPLAGVRVLGGQLGLGSLASMVLDGLLVGIAVGLAGVGLSMTYAILEFANFAHGDTVTVGAFLGWVAAYVAGGLGTGASLERLVAFGAGQQLSVAATPGPVVLGLLVAAVGTAVLALLVDRLVYRPMRDAHGISLLIASIGVALALRYLLAFAFGSSTSGVASRGFRLVVFEAGGRAVAVTDNELALLAVGVASMVGVHALLQRTELGKAMRAMADDEDLARVTGIPTERVVALTWTIGGALAGLAGFLLVLESGTISFNFGWILLLLIFAAVILGGIGSIYGAMVGGVLVGLVDSLALIWLPAGLTRAAAFLALIVVLLLRPEGVFGGVSTA